MWNWRDLNGILKKIAINELLNEHVFNEATEQELEWERRRGGKNLGQSRLMLPVWGILMLFLV